jgi:PIN domain nuclease of toxin-antitoxin system
VKLLLDTHTMLWLVEGSPKLSGAAQTALADPTNELFLSAASVWELAIKTTSAKQRLVLSDPLHSYIAKWSAAYQLRPLPIQSNHALEVAKLPIHHRDPFDRMLIAQALTERMTLVSGDAQFGPYSVPLLW